LSTDATMAKGVAALYVANITTLALNTAFLVLVTNKMSLTQVGLVSLLNVVVVGGATLAVLALPIVTAGASATPPAVVRFLPEAIEKKEKTARTVYLLSLAVCAVVSIAVALAITLPSVASTITGPLDAKIVGYAALDVVVYSFGQLGAYSLLGAGRTTQAGTLITGSSLLRYILAGALLLLKFGIPGIFIGFAVGDLVLAAPSNLVAFRSVNGARLGSFPAKPVLSYMLSVLVAGAVGFGVSQTDKLLAVVQKGLGNLGIYNIAAVGAAVASFAPAAATNVLVPALASYGAAPERKREVLKAYTRYVSVIAAPMGFGLAAVSPFLLRLFGEAYVAGAPSMSVISVAIALTAVSSVYSSALLVENRAHHFSAGSVMGLLALVAVALLTVPTLGLLGIALGRAAMLFVLLAFFAYFAKLAGSLVLDAGAYVKSMASASAMAAIVFAILYSIQTYAVNGRAEVVVASLVMIPVGFALYLVIMKLLKGFSEADIDFIEKVMPGWLSWVSDLARKLL